MDLAKSRSSGLEIGEFTDGPLDHSLEIRDIDSGDILFVNSLDLKSKAGREIFFVTDHNVDILGDFTIHLLRLSLPSDRPPKARPVVEVIRNNGSVFFGDLTSLDRKRSVTLRESGENPTRVEPSNTEGSKNMLEIKIINRELGSRSMATVRGYFSSTNSKTTLSEIEPVAGGNTKSIKVSPLNKLGVDSALEDQIL